jgi:transcriptional regulator with XRE-family HTH domain
MTTSVTKVVGVNVRALRRDAGITLDQFAVAAQAAGLAWSSGRVGTLESGNMAALSLETLIALAAATGQLIGREVRLAELLATHDEVTITEQLHIGGAALTMAVTGQPVTASFSGEGTLTATVYPLREADRRTCQSLGVDIDTGLVAMYRLWNKPFTAERDRIAEPGANAQRLGIIARRLKSQLREELDRGDS